MDGERLPRLRGQALGARPLAGVQGAQAGDGSGAGKPGLVRVEKLLLQADRSLQPRQTFRATTGAQNLAAQLNVVDREMRRLIPFFRRQQLEGGGGVAALQLDGRECFGMTSA